MAKKSQPRSKAQRKAKKIEDLPATRRGAKAVKGGRTGIVTEQITLQSSKVDLE